MRNQSGRWIYILNTRDTTLEIRDARTGEWCLVDSGAMLCIYPHVSKDTRPILKAVNGSPIATYGVTSRTV